MTSSGSSMCVGPGFWPCATLNALRTASGIIRALLSRVFHLVIGLNIETTSMYWWLSLCVRSRSPWPVSTTIGERSRKASAIAGDEVRRPRPERAEADARAAGEAAVHVGHVGAALLVADGDELDRRVRERAVELERLLAGDAEDVLDALRLEAVDEEVRGVSFVFRHQEEASQLPSPLGVCLDVAPSMKTRILSLFAAAIAVLALAAPAGAAKTRFTVRGAGWGHGVGMSQWGAYGFATQGWGYREILAHYYTDTGIGSTGSRDGARPAPGLDRDRALQRRDVGRRPATLNPGTVYRVRRGATAGTVDLLSPSGRRLKRVTAPLRATGAGPLTARRRRAATAARSSSVRPGPWASPRSTPSASRTTCAASSRASRRPAGRSRR